jgi:hypothetical protein
VDFIFPLNYLTKHKKNISPQKKTLNTQIPSHTITLNNNKPNSNVTSIEFHTNVCTASRLKPTGDLNPPSGWMMVVMKLSPRLITQVVYHLCKIATAKGFQKPNMIVSFSGAKKNIYSSSKQYDNSSRFYMIDPT